LVLLISVASFAATHGDFRLIEAVRKGDKEAVRSLLVQHVDVNTPQPDGGTAIAWAVHRDDLETAELLIRAGADVNTANEYGVTPLWMACSNGNAAMIEKLLNAGANPNAAIATGETALLTAANSGNVDAVKTLLAHGANVNAKEPQWGQNALIWAAAEKHPEVVRVLIEHGADVHARSQRGFTPLLFAAQVGDVESARLLLAAGSNVNETVPVQDHVGGRKTASAPKEPDASDSGSPGSDSPAKGKNQSVAEIPWGEADGMSPLLLATASGQEALAIFLLENGADPNATDGNGITSLHYALRRGISIVGNVQSYTPLGPNPYTAHLVRPAMLQLVKALLAHGANPNAQLPMQLPEPPFTRGTRLGTIGMTPFFLAAAAGDLDAMHILLAGGANPKLATKEGVTPLMVATGRGRYQDFAPGEEKLCLEAAKLVLEVGGEINGADSKGVTSLHAAAHIGANAIVQFLVQRGASVNVKDKLGQTPWTLAEGIISEGATRAEKIDAPHPETAKLLVKLGANVMTAEDLPAAPPPEIEVRAKGVGLADDAGRYDKGAFFPSVKRKVDNAPAGAAKSGTEKPSE